MEQHFYDFNEIFREALFSGRTVPKLVPVEPVGYSVVRNLKRTQCALWFNSGTPVSGRIHEWIRKAFTSITYLKPLQEQYGTVRKPVIFCFSDKKFCAAIFARPSVEFPTPDLVLEKNREWKENLLTSAGNSL